MEDARLERQDVVADPADRLQIGRVGLAECFDQLRRGDADLVGASWPCRRAASVYSSTASRPRSLHVAADPLDDLLRRERLAERRDRAGPVCVR